MSRFVITSAASADLDAIEAYIAEDNPDTARRVILELRAAMHKLVDFPGLGHRRSDLSHPSYRFWTVYSYLIVYNPDTDPLEIVRVIHGYRDVPAVLQTDS